MGGRVVEGGMGCLMGWIVLFFLSLPFCFFAWYVRLWDWLRLDGVLGLLGVLDLLAR